MNTNIMNTQFFYKIMYNLKSSFCVKKLTFSIDILFGQNVMLSEKYMIANIIKTLFTYRIRYNPKVD